MSHNFNIFRILFFIKYGDEKELQYCRYYSCFVDEIDSRKKVPMIFFQPEDVEGRFFQMVASGDEIQVSYFGNPQSSNQSLGNLLERSPFEETSHTEFGYSESDSGISTPGPPIPSVVLENSDEHNCVGLEIGNEDELPRFSEIKRQKHNEIERRRREREHEEMKLLMEACKGDVDGEIELCDKPKWEKIAFAVQLIKKLKNDMHAMKEERTKSSSACLCNRKGLGGQINSHDGGAKLSSSVQVESPASYELGREKISSFRGGVLMEYL